MSRTRVVLIGRAVLEVGSSDRLGIAECCETCKHVIGKCEIDGCDELACTRLGKPPKAPSPLKWKWGWWRVEKYRKISEAYTLWWTTRAVRAWTICPHYSRKRTAVNFACLETDATREAAKKEKSDG